MIGFPKTQYLRSFLLLTLIATTLPLHAQKANRLPRLNAEVNPGFKERAPQIHARYKGPLYEAVITTRGDLHVLPVTEGEGTGKALPLEYRLSVSRDTEEGKQKTRHVVKYTVSPEAADQPEKVVFKGTHEDDVVLECIYTFSEKSITVEATCTEPEDLAVPNVFITRWVIPGTHTFTDRQEERERKTILKGYELKTRGRSSTTSYAEENGPNEAFRHASIETHWPGRVLGFDFDQDATFHITDYDKEPRLYKGYSFQPQGDKRDGVTKHQSKLSFE